VPQPFRELSSLQSEMNRLFNTAFGDLPNGGTGGSRRWMPAMALLETDDDFVLRADIPGMTESDEQRKPRRISIASGSEEPRTLEGTAA
jgi:HSP20 family molecular chaperone IbpA